MDVWRVIERTADAAIKNRATAFEVFRTRRGARLTVAVRFLWPGHRGIALPISGWPVREQAAALVEH